MHHYTPTQKVLFCLVDKKKKTAKAVHTCSKIAYATVLKILDDLEANNLVVCTPGKPRVYQLEESVEEIHIQEYLAQPV